MDIKLYKSNNELQTKCAKSILEDLNGTFNWKSCEYVLDIGSGPGNVTADIIRPFVSDNCKIVGSDISEEMINYANKTYSSENLIFKKLDIQKDCIWNDWKKDSFDKIFSFYCLHWISDLRQAVSNIHALLKPEGEILLVLLPSNPLYSFYKHMSSSPKWSTYMQDISKVKSPLQLSIHPAQDFTDLLKSVHFNDVNVTLKEYNFTFPSEDSHMKAVEALTPFIKEIPSNLYTEFLEDLKDTIPKCSRTEVKQDGSSEVWLNILIARASKPKNDAA